ncbi:MULTISPECIES: DUF2306 domain-containing protein [Halocynthiibacter]|uniref:DUF2306 domain-containing protein n=1 Tax=Halocynthiibacter halioticoli TaxID=2986804 RepID=A0AAE3J111_9RHOB|nr:MULTISPECIES: DUF2306 domain-containing protein [Halocynthiibacter]MCV6825813.1 DUF2306 domain-containing protein [Halocynthiibacter halioticoli]MCW4058814.1 DUF2306 domain-containing protein [Halocynthiibacter sp. SDUM655004]
MRIRETPWLTPTLLITISLIPIAATTNRMLAIVNYGANTKEGAERFAEFPLVLITHILFGSLFLVLASFQFSRPLRQRFLRWHMFIGRVAAVSAVISAATGIWLIVGFPTGPLATKVSDALRVLFAVALLGSVLLAVRSITLGQKSKHRAWMIRAFAIGVAGSTQAILIGIWFAIAGVLTPVASSVLLPLGWTINLIIAEAIIRSKSKFSPIEIGAKS